MSTKAQTSPVIKSTKSPSTSPKSTAKIIEDTFDFPTAMRKVIEGYGVSKVEWNDSSIIVYLEGYLRIRLPDGLHNLLVTEGDMLGTDWFVTGSFR